MDARSFVIHDGMGADRSILICVCKELARKESRSRGWAAFMHRDTVVALVRGRL